jgi:hypothetical protein
MTMADTNEPNETPEDASRLKKALTAEREVSKAARAELNDVKVKLKQAEALGAHPDGAKVTAHISAAIAAGVAAKSAESMQRIAALEAQLSEANSTAEKLKGTLTQRTISETVREACRANHVRNEAVNDLLSFSANELHLADDGTILTHDGQDLDAWIDQCKASRPWAWPVSKGSGARGNEALTGLIDTGANPFVKGSPDYNLTRQGEILQSNPARAEMLQKSAAAMTRN